MIDVHAHAIRKRVDRWISAGVVDADTGARILAFEATGRAPGLPISTAVGAVSLALGLIAIVSANWDALPVALKLGVHATLNLALGVWLWRGVTNQTIGATGGAMWRETLVLTLSASTLALIAHVGQSFQLQGATINAVAFWLVLVTPFTWALARHPINRLTWIAGLLWFVGLAAELWFDWLESHRLLGTAFAVALIFGFAAPVMGRALAVARPWGDDLWRVAFAALVVTTTGAQAIWYDPPLEDMRPEALADLNRGVIIAAAGLAVVGLLAWRSLKQDGRLAALIAVSPLLAASPIWLATGASVWLSTAGHCLYWAALAHIARHGGLIGWYRLAVLVVMGRLLFFFLEAFGGLLTTGLGLIATGLTLLAFGYLTKRLFQRVKPEAAP